MASTNKTANYNLSQFVGSDKPAWLSDYNQDMTKIDTGIKNAADTATSASGSASAATTAIGDLTNLTTTAKTDLVSAVNEVDSNADTAQNTANEAYTTATGAMTKATALESALNIDNITTCIVTKSNNISSLESVNIKCATNDDTSLFKIYGQLIIAAPANTQNASLTITNTGLGVRDNPYDIEGAVLSFRNDSSVNVFNLRVNADGSITIPNIFFGASTATRIYLAPILYFDKNFGD